MDLVRTLLVISSAPLSLEIRSDSKLLDLQLAAR